PRSLPGGREAILRWTWGASLVFWHDLPSPLRGGLGWGYAGPKLPLDMGSFARFRTNPTALPPPPPPPPAASAPAPGGSGAPAGSRRPPPPAHGPGSGCPGSPAPS